MKSKIILILVTLLIAQPAISKESGGYQFWHGTGGKVVGALGIYGLYYWLSDDESEAVEKAESSNLTFYQTSNNLQVNFLYPAYSDKLEENNLNLKYQFAKLEGINAYGFAGFNRTVGIFDSVGLNAKQTDVYGFGLSYSPTSKSLVIFEVSELAKFDRFNSDSYKLNYQYRF